MKFECKPGSHFLESRPSSISIELIPMVPEEDEVSLVVPGDHSPLLQLGILRKQRSNHSADPGTQHGIGIVEDELWRYHLPIISTMIGYLLIK